LPSPYPTALGEARGFLDAHPDIESFHMIFTDLSGVARGKILRREEVLGAFENGRFLPGSVMSIDATGRDVEETGGVWDDGDADRIAWPLPGTLVTIPWVSGEPAAQFVTTLHETDGRPCINEPRQTLARVVERFAEFDLTPVAAIELEFYLMDREAALAGKPRPPRGLTNGARPRHFQPYLLQDTDDFAPFFDDMYAACKVQGLPARSLISEYAPGQMEVVLKHRADALRACDEAIMFKRLIRSVADRHGLLASFMAKPYSQFTGCGMHVHASMARPDGANAFAAASAAESPLMLKAIAGLKETMAGAMAFFAPNANSYRRFRRSSYAPVAPTWGVNNRTVSIRVPAGAGETMHLEHRAAGADANPYLALAAVLAGMHHGMAEKLDPGPAVTGNGYEQPAPRMPSNWFDALDALRASAVMAEYLGQDFVAHFATLKEIEADRFYAEPTERDYAWYLRTV
jgi:glutamine synthetase